MHLNMDLTQRLVLDTAAMEWVQAPVPGISRCLLEREAAESGRATSLVRYDPATHFPAHVHEGGEEILVLSGSLTDEDGHYPQGTYLRNPPGSSHAPWSDEGCELLVKLCQMSDRETGLMRMDTANGEWISRGPGLPERMPLFSTETQGAHPGEKVALVRFAPGTRVEGDLHAGGEEVLVLEGVLEDEFGRYPQGTWLRQPAGSSHSPFSTGGCVLFVKRDHLVAAPAT